MFYKKRYHMKKSILVTGANGYIAQSIINKFKSIYDITAISREDFDLINYNKLNEWFKNKYFDIVIHTAAVGGNRLISESLDIKNDNILMFKNLAYNQKHFNKLITFGSGAEIYASNTPYGSSKKTISSIINKYNNFYNLRIYAVFDHNEADRRFIKSNIRRYISGQNLIIHKDKLMDFIYMPDLLSIIGEYIINDELPNTIDCVYNTKYKLSEIARFINSLDSSRTSEISMVSDEIDTQYIGSYLDIGLNFIGIEKGIYNTFNIMVNNYEKNMVRSK